jgi:uncharacterized protein (DUF58 family)
MSARTAPQGSRVVSERWHLARLHRWLSLDGSIGVERPWALLPGPLALLLAGFLPARWLFFVAYAYLLLIVLAYLWVRSTGQRIRLRRNWSGAWLQAGDTVEEQWELTNSGWLPLLWLEIDDASTLPGYTSRWVAAAGPGERQQWRTDIVCRRRGIYTLGPFRARLGDPWGIFSYTWAAHETQQLLVYPPLLALPPLAMPYGRQGGLMQANLLQQQTTPSIGGLRPYVPGDMLSRVHWPSVAKTQQLMVKEFDQERAGALWLVLDCAAAAYAVAEEQALPARASHEPVYQQSSLVATPTMLDLSSPLELAIALSCSLAAQALTEGRAVGLLANDGRQRLLMPGRGVQQLWRILSALTDVQASGSAPLGTVLRQGQAAVGAAASGTAVAVVTPDLGGEWLAALANWRRGPANGALALLVARDEALTQPISARLASLGVIAHSFETGADLPLLNPPKPRAVQRVSPLGKIVR